MSRQTMNTRKNFRLEALESRELLAGSVTLADGILTVRGTGVADVAQATMKVVDGTSSVEVTLNRAVSRFAASDVQKIIFHGLAGNDRFTATPAIAVPVEAHGGAGNDTLLGGGGHDWISGDGGNDVLTGRSGDDFIYGGFGNDTIYGNAGNDWLYGNQGNDTILGHAGEDNLFGNAGPDILFGGAGADTLVSLDGAATDVVYGELGFDSFWLDKNGVKVDVVKDARPIERGNIHAIARFANGADRTLDGDAIADPKSDHRTNFADHWLFASGGPSADDIRQGGIGDCWLLSSLAATAKLSPNAIRQTVVDLGDGTFAVSLGQKFYRVDADLPTTGDGNGELIYAQLGQENTLWVPIVEKAFTMWRTNNAEYNAIDGGFMTKALRGVGSTGIAWRNFSFYAEGQTLLNVIDNRLGARKAVAIGIYTHPSDAPLFDSHAYTVIQVNRDANGTPVSVLLRNPWGVDGAGDDGSNDGYITVTVDQLFQCQGVVCWGTVRA